MNPEIPIVQESLHEAKPSFMLTGEIEDFTSDEFLEWLGYWGVNDPQKDLSVFINSPGGSYFAATSMAEAMQISPNKIRTVVTGECYSGAAIIAAAGDKNERYAYKASHFMIHQLQTFTFMEQESVAEKEEQFKMLKQINDKAIFLISTFTGQKADKVRKDTKKDKWMDAKAALAYGLVDHIIEWKK